MSQFPSPRLSVGQILNPRSIAVVGASEDLHKFGSRVLNNTINGGFSGEIIPVNPKRDQIFGRPAVASISQIETPPDIAVIAVPREFVPAIVDECANHGVGCCVVITAGFGEIDEDGARVQEKLVDTARSSGMRLIGPNCLGLLNTHANLLLNSSPAMEVTPFRAGGIAHITQSGALLATVYNRGVEDHAYFSTSVSLGNQADLELADFVEYLAEDPNTRVVTLYVEGFRNPERFIQAIRRCRDAGKPVLMTKSGITAYGARVTRSHTASLATPHRVLQAVCREEGVLLVDDIRGLIQTAEFFSRYGQPSGDGVCVISGSGGAAALTADRIAERGLRLSEFCEPTRQRLEVIYEPTQLGNPLDAGALKEKSFTNVDDGGLSIAAAEPDVDVMLIAITTGPMIGNTTRCMADAVIAAGKPALFVIMQGNADDGARMILEEKGLLCFETLEEGLRVLERWLSAGKFDTTAETAIRPPDLPGMEVAPGLPIRPTEHEVKMLVARYGITVVDESVATSVHDAGQDAANIGYPVVLKAVSRDLVHKSDAGGVKLGLDNEAEVHAAWHDIHAAVGATLEGCLVARMEQGEAEMILGILNDPEFGPMVLFGFGGLMAEVINDVKLAPAPVSERRAKELLSELALGPILDGVRGKSPLDADAVAAMICRLSWLAVDAREWLKELDLNPVIVKPKGAVVVDARASVDNPAG